MFVQDLQQQNQDRLILLLEYNFVELFTISVRSSSNNEIGNFVRVR